MLSGITNQSEHYIGHYKEYELLTYKYLFYKRHKDYLPALHPMYTH